MANFDKFKLTKQGLNLLAQAQLGKTLTFTAVKVGDGEIDETTDVATFTKLVSEINADIGIAYHEIIGEGKTQLMTRLNGGSEGFCLREVGIYAKIDSGTEVLYAYTNAHDTADYIPAAGGPTAVVYDLNLITVIGNAQSVSATITAKVGVDYSHRTSNTLDHPDGSVKTSKLADGAVTANKLADKNVTSAKLSTDVTDIINGKLDKYIVAGVPEMTTTVDFNDGNTAFKAVERCTVSVDGGNLAVTTSANAGNKYAISNFDFSDIAANADKFNIEMDVKLPSESRWCIAFADLNKRPGASKQSGYDATGTALYCGTQYANMLYVNGVYKFGETVFDVWLHIKADVDLETKKVIYTFSNADTGGLLATETVSFADTTIDRITGIELYSWANSCMIYVDNVSITAQYITSENALYLVKKDNAAYDVYIYVDDTFVCIAPNVVTNIADGAVTKEKIASGVLFSGDYNDLSNRPNIASVSADGLMSASDKGKLDSIPGNITTVEMTSYTESTSLGDIALSIVCDENIEQDVLKYYQLSDNCGIVSHLNNSAGATYTSCTLNGTEIIDGDTGGVSLEEMFKKLTSTHVLHWSGTEWGQVEIDRIYANLEERVASLEERIASLEVAMTSTTEEGEV